MVSKIYLTVIFAFEKYGYDVTLHLFPHNCRGICQVNPSIPTRQCHYLKRPFLVMFIKKKTVLPVKFLEFLSRQKFVPVLLIAFRIMVAKFVNRLR